jgi:uncharacterized protein YndB with AHSA1/START domain
MKGTLQRHPGRHTLRFERRLAHSPETVWRVLTDNDELAYWFPARIDGAREAGAALRFVFFEKSAEVMDGELRAMIAAAQKEAERWPAEVMTGEMRIYDPPRTLEYTWGGEVLRFELRPRDGATELVFTHTFADEAQAVKVGAGWHIGFDALAGHLDGAQAQATKADLDALEADYAQRFAAERPEP